MANLFLYAGRRCMQPSKYRRVVKEWTTTNSFVCNAGRITQPKCNFSTNTNGDVFEKSTEVDTKDSSSNIKSDPSHVCRSTENVDSGTIPSFIKLEENDVAVSKAIAAVNSKKNRQNRTKILLEGNRLISDAIRFGVAPEVIFFSRVQDVKKIKWPAVDFQMYKVPYRTIKIWSSLKTSPGIIGIFKKPNIDAIEESENSVPLIVVCDNIRDPGNLGSILRIAAGVGSQCLLLTKGCVDLWDPKVLRAGAGAHFVLPIHYDCSWEEIEKRMENESTVILADSHCSSSSGVESVVETKFLDYLPLKLYHKVDYSGAWEESNPIVLVLGGETEGLSKEACELAESRGGIRLHIPLHNEVESLNAGTALAVITFEIRRQYEEWSKKIVHLPLSHKNSM